jgi:hypothetical protein
MMDDEWLVESSVTITSRTNRGKKYEVCYRDTGMTGGTIDP